MSINSDRERLSQVEMLEWLRRDLQLTDMVTVYLSRREGCHNHGILCAFVPSGLVEEVLSNTSWDLRHGEGMPGTIEYYEGGKRKIEYLRFGNDEGLEPLIIEHEFHGMREDYREISEEFRLFHRLYHDRKLDQYFKIDEEGSETLVAIDEPNCTRIRLKEIRQFLAVKEMHLSIQFDCKEFSMHSLEQLGLAEGGEDQREGHSSWGHYCGDLSGVGENESFSRLIGKRLIDPLPKSKSGFCGFREERKQKYVEFIIGVDAMGDDVTFTSDPDALANYFGANPDAPNFLTPVHFRKQVLDKYYHQPSKYSVEDAYLRCGSLWGLQMDNHHPEKVCAWLGDLGQHLPYKDQLHWRSYNVPPEGSVSETYFRRQILAQATDSERPEHRFKQRYHDLQLACDECLGWQVLLPLEADDMHHFQCIRIPATDEQRDFDELVLSLAKILIDSLNEKDLTRFITREDRGGLKGSLARLEAALVACGVQDAKVHVSFLRKLQQLRSSSSAHRKGSNYRKIAAEFGIESQSLRGIIAGILSQALLVLDCFIAVVRSGQISKD
ncbi:MAG: hypothetical protein MI725_14285 [Pirellulales bacterium]|nr:hypothetical protein [Pirellulales bacterium]